MEISLLYAPYRGGLQVAELQAVSEIIDRHHDPVPELFRMTVAALEIAIAERDAAREALILIRNTRCTAGFCLKTAVEGLARSHRALPTPSLATPEAPKGVTTAENACGEAGEGAQSDRSRDGTGAESRKNEVGQ